ncbi:MAG TPA: hypothetical protein VE420_04970 [Gemmatimonadales bacterium]|jgi:hypothetical protein|nr:hypothetical protein [Gemmatimonadales bacterium]
MPKVTNTTTSVPEQTRPTWRQDLISAVDHLIDKRIKAAHHAAEHDRRQEKGQGIRPSLMFLTE